MLGRTSCGVKPSQEGQLSLHVASGLVFHTLPRMTHKHSWIGSQEPHWPIPQIVLTQGRALTFPPPRLFLPSLMGRNGCPVVPLALSSSK